MKIEAIELIPLSTKKIIVREMCNLYKKLRLLEINQKNGQKLMEDNKKIEQKLEILKSKSIFEAIMDLLDNNQKLIINNEFIERKRQDWGDDYWSKSTFYKRKHEAINTFIFYLYA